jgi:hypothetical protein
MMGQLKFVFGGTERTCKDRNSCNKIKTFLKEAGFVYSGISRMGSTAVVCLLQLEGTFVMHVATVRNCPEGCRGMLPQTLFLTLAI